MKVSKAAKIWLDYHQVHSKKNTVRANSFIKDKFCQQFGEDELNDLSVDLVLDFLNRLTADRKPQTKRTRFTSLLAFFNTERGAGPSDRIHPHYCGYNQTSSKNQRVDIYKIVGER